MFIRAPRSLAAIGPRPSDSAGFAQRGDGRRRFAQRGQVVGQQDRQRRVQIVAIRATATRPMPGQRRVNALLVRQQMGELPIAKRFFRQSRISEARCRQSWRRRRSFPRTTGRPWRIRPPREPIDRAETGRRPSADGPTRHARPAARSSVATAVLRSPAAASAVPNGRSTQACDQLFGGAGSPANSVIN